MGQGGKAVSGYSLLINIKSTTLITHPSHTVNKEIIGEKQKKMFFFCFLLIQVPQK